MFYKFEHAIVSFVELSNGYIGAFAHLAVYCNVAVNQIIGVEQLIYELNPRFMRGGQPLSEDESFNNR